MDDSFQPDFLKPLDKVFFADERNVYGFPSVEIAFRQHYQLIEKIELNGNVHNDIKVQFETAKNVLFYSFFAYRLGMVGLKQAFAALELGLRRYVGEPENPVGKKRPHNGLTALLERAHKKGMFSTNNLNNPNLTFDDFLRIVKGFRNQLAHGTHTLFPPSHVTPIVHDCASVLNQVFDYVKINNLRQSRDGWE